MSDNDIGGLSSAQKKKKKRKEANLILKKNEQAVTQAIVHKEIISNRVVAEVKPKC